MKACSCPENPMPEGFTDRAAWDAIHWKFSESLSDRASSLLDQAVIGWQLANQDRVKAAVEAQAKGDNK